MTPKDAPHPAQGESSELQQRVAGITARLLSLVEAGAPGRSRDEMQPLPNQASPRTAASPGERPGAAPAFDRELAAMIDHTLLRPDASREDVLRLCDEARAFGFASVCVNSVWVPLARFRLDGCGVGLCATAAFPLGASPTEAKAGEAAAAVGAGASEIDMVMNIGALKSGDWAAVFFDLHGVIQAAHPARVKVILECALLTEEEKIIASVAAKLAGASFVKTSTGFAGGGATKADVRLLRSVVGHGMGVKAAGGIRDAATARELIAAGANRIGSSASVAIVTASAPGLSGATRAPA